MHGRNGMPVRLTSPKIREHAHNRPEDRTCYPAPTQSGPVGWRSVSAHPRILQIRHASFTRELIACRSPARSHPLPTVDQ